MKYNFIKTKVQDFIFYLTLSRPEKKNAFTPTTVNEIADAFQKANANEAVKVVVLRAEGSVFCAGMDLKTFEDQALDIRNPHIENKNVSLGEVFANLHKPSVALVEGDVIAGAFMMIAGCTYVFCSEQVRFRLPELSIGLFPFQVMGSLLQVMSEKKLLQLCLHTDYFPAVLAMEYGLVDGFLEKMDVEAFLYRFKEMNAHVLLAGFKAARKLPAVANEQRYEFLLESLQALKSSR